MDLLRQAVGDEQLTFAGYSYGGLLGMTYAQLFPAKVRAVMLDGAPDPVAWTTGRPADRRQPFSLRVGSNTATSDALGFFLDSCQAAGDACAFASGDTRAKFDELMARLLAGPITVDLPPGPIGPGGPTTLTYAFVVDGLRGGLQFPPIWADLAGLLQATFEAPDTSAAATVDQSSEPEAAPTEDGYDNSRDALFAVACSETNNPNAVSRWTKQAAAADRATPYFGADWTWLSLPCATWPARTMIARRGRSISRPRTRCCSSTVGSTRPARTTERSRSPAAFRTLASSPSRAPVIRPPFFPTNASATRSAISSSRCGCQTPERSASPASSPSRDPRQNRAAYMDRGDHAMTVAVNCGCGSNPTQP